MDPRLTLRLLLSTTVLWRGYTLAMLAMVEEQELLHFSTHAPSPPLHGIQSRQQTVATYRGQRPYRAHRGR